MTQITLSIDDTTVLARLAELSAALTPAGMRGAYREIGEQLAESTQQRFASSTGPDGTRWSALKPGTVLATLQKMSQGRSGYFHQKGENKGRITQKPVARLAGRKPLVDTGQLAHGIRYQVDDTGVEIGTNRFAEKWDGGAAVHQFGTRDGRILARPFLGLSTGDKTTVLEIIGRHLRGGPGQQ